MERQDDADSNDRCLLFPPKRDLVIGWNVVRNFAAAHAPEHADKIAGFFERRRAYRKFNDLLHELDLLTPWQAFEYKTVHMSLRNWCEDNDIEIIENAV